jgi:HK97 family phage prohead protease
MNQETSNSAVLDDPIRIERRLAAIEAHPDDGRRFSGYAAVWDSPSLPLPFTETITRGAFSRTLEANNRIHLLHAHNPELILASTRGGTLRLQEDDRGLRVEADLADTTWGRDVAELVRRGDIGSMSIGFSVPHGGDAWTDDGGERTLNEVRLHEVSTVGSPAYDSTTASVRSSSLDPQLFDALERLGSGHQLSSADADLVRRAADELGPQPEPSTPIAVLARITELNRRK